MVLVQSGAYANSFATQFVINYSFTQTILFGTRFATVRAASEKRSGFMAKQMVHMDGEDMNVREDTAKAFRGTYWALYSIAAFILIIAILFFGGFFAWLFGASHGTPAPSGPSQDNIRR